MWYNPLMNIQERITVSEQQFEAAKARRDEHLRAAEEELSEMTKLQGEWRVLQELLADQSKKVNKKATVVEAVPEGETV
jgi:hypothetical protein